QLKRLLKQILGIKSEKSKKVFDQKEPEKPDADSDTGKTKGDVGKKQDKKRKGHGRNGVEHYTGAERIHISHPSLSSGSPCPQCPKGKVYKEKKPGIFIYIEGQAPIGATVFELEKLRCNLCGVIFQAPLPAEIAGEDHGSRHYDETAKSMMVILRYGYGLPLNRLSSLQADLGIPLAVSTGWDKSEEAADKVYSAFEELKRHGAQGDILHNDDTGMKILTVMDEIKQEVEDANGKKVRTGIFTTGIVSISDGRKIALFFTGRKHAGENFSDLLEQRDSDRSPPIQMCDAKSGNTKKDSDTIVSNCNTHARRYFVEEADNFPDECSYVIIDVYKTIYKNDAVAKAKGMSPDDRLRFHKEKSGPVMDDFQIWLNKQMDEKLVEPNSGLGQAISYVLNHWSKLVQFLCVPGVPLDNNICEQALKKSICHRKNSLFYKTEHGAYIGDMFMSLIHTCSLNGENPFDYITELQKHSADVFKCPSNWLPWNYKDRLKDLIAAQQPNLKSVSNPV
ncbi:MAG: IS66 family transposase, partial [Pseudomonadota bacterium]|nr:IS66 family transposase [Pseudomonadota bacterium]